MSIAKAALPMSTFGRRSCRLVCRLVLGRFHRLRRDHRLVEGHGLSRHMNKYPSLRFLLWARIWPLPILSSSSSPRSSFLTMEALNGQGALYGWV